MSSKKLNLIVSLFILNWTIPQLTASTAKPDIQEIGTVSQAISIQALEVSASAGRIAMVVQADGKINNLVVDGKTILATTDGIPWIGFSPDGSHLAFVRENSLGKNVFLDERVESSFDDISYTSIVWSADGRHFAYAGRKGMEWSVVHNGVEGATRNGVAPPSEMTFTENGDHLAYVVHDRDSKRVVLDEVAGDTFADVKNLLMSSNGKHICFAASPSVNQWMVVRDGKKSLIGLGVEHLVMSNDGAHWAYIMRMPADDLSEKLSRSVVVDGLPSGRFTLITAGPLFSEDGAHVAFVGAKALGMINKAQTYDAFLSVDGNKSFALSSRINWVRELATRDGQNFGAIATVVVNGGQADIVGQQACSLIVNKQLLGPAADRAIALELSPDGKHAACLFRAHDALEDASWCVNVDGKIGKLYKRVANVVFSPDSMHIAYAAKNANDKWVIVVDSVELTEYEPLLRSAKGGPVESWKMLEDFEGKPNFSQLDGVMLTKAELPYWFDGTGAVHFFTLRDGKISKVQYRP